jgi:hypothetical protein
VLQLLVDEAVLEGLVGEDFDEFARVAVHAAAPEAGMLRHVMTVDVSFSAAAGRVPSAAGWATGRERLADMHKPAAALALVLAWRRRIDDWQTPHMLMATLESQLAILLLLRPGAEAERMCSVLHALPPYLLLLARSARELSLAQWTVRGFLATGIAAVLETVSEFLAPRDPDASRPALSEQALVDLMDVVECVLALYPLLVARAREAAGVAQVFVYSAALAMHDAEWGPETPWVVRSRVLALAEQACRLIMSLSAALPTAMTGGTPEGGERMLGAVLRVVAHAAPRFRCGLFRGGRVWPVCRCPPGHAPPHILPRPRPQGAVPGGVRVPARNAGRAQQPHPLLRAPPRTRPRLAFVFGGVRVRAGLVVRVAQLRERVVCEPRVRPGPGVPPFAACATVQRVPGDHVLRRGVPAGRLAAAPGVLPRAAGRRELVKQKARKHL